MLDVYIYESEKQRDDDVSSASEVWEGAPCVPRVGDLLTLRADLGRKVGERTVLSVAWFSARENPPTRLHAYVVVGPAASR